MIRRPGLDVAPLEVAGRKRVAGSGRDRYELDINVVIGLLACVVVALEEIAEPSLGGRDARKQEVRRIGAEGDHFRTFEIGFCEVDEVMTVAAVAAIGVHCEESHEAVVALTDGRDHTDLGGEADRSGLIRSVESLRQLSVAEPLLNASPQELGYRRKGVRTDKGKGFGSHGTEVRIRSVTEGDERREMKAAVYYETGGPEVFRFEEIPDPVAPPGGVLVKVEAISIEGGDTLHRSGGDISTVPHIVGYQCAGTVVETGPGTANLAVGDRVVTVGLDGSHAELRAVPEGFCWKIPDGLSTDEAACIPVAFGTAYDCLFEFGRLTAGGIRAGPGRCERGRDRRDPVREKGRGTRAGDRIL